MTGRDHAVVIGGGIGGLLAARVLSEAFDRVTIVERDELQDEMDDRRGVPQGRHVHGLQARGVEVFDDLFPGLLAEAERDGASVVTDLSRCHFAPGGRLLSQAPGPRPGCCSPRGRSWRGRCGAVSPPTPASPCSTAPW